MGKGQESWNAHCGICHQPIGHLREVVGQVCFSCTGKVTDEKGRRIVFWTTPRPDGHTVSYLDNNEPRQGDECYIGKIRCRALRSQLGGYIFQVEPTPKAKG
jgi:hypothetical protein